MIAVLLTALSLATVHVGPCPGYEADPFVLGCASPPSSVWVPADAAPWVLHHELGHILDYQRMTFHKRMTWKRVMHLRTFDKELFAESFAACVEDSHRVTFGPTGYDYSPSDRQHRRVCRLLRTLAKEDTA